MERSLLSPLTSIIKSWSPKSHYNYTHFAPRSYKNRGTFLEAKEKKTKKNLSSQERTCIFKGGNPLLIKEQLRSKSLEIKKHTI